MTNHRVIIIGGGPAGYTAAIYAARAQLHPLVFEGSQLGGALMNTTEVENYPGFETGIMGPDLMMTMRAQAERFGATLVSDDVTSVELGEQIKTVTTLGSQHAADTVILAMGSAHRKLGQWGEDELSGRGVSYCATCDGFFFKGKDVAVVGGGDTAMEEAIFLTKFANSVTIVHRSQALRASKTMIERAEANDKISWVLDHQVAALHSVDGVLSGLTLRDTTDPSPIARGYLACQGMFVAIGHDPRSELVKGQIALDSEGYVLTGGPGTAATATSVAGAFAAGDLVDHTYRQAITAAGSGCQAAIDVERYLVNR